MSSSSSFGPSSYLGFLLLLFAPPGIEDDGGGECLRLVGCCWVAEEVAVVVVDGPADQREVDARPSDAVNLAVVSGAPIRLNSELFSVGIAPDDSEEPSSFTVATADIAAETQQRMREAAQRYGRRSGPQPSGGAASADQ